MTEGVASGLPGGDALVAFAEAAVLGDEAHTREARERVTNQLRQRIAESMNDEAEDAIRRAEMRAEMRANGAEGGSR